jgi:hypothetical protein
VVQASHPSVFLAVLVAIFASGAAQELAGCHAIADYHHYRIMARAASHARQDFRSFRATRRVIHLSNAALELVVSS